MPRAVVVVESAIKRTPRVQQLEGLFDVPPAQRSDNRWEVDLPIEDRDWLIGLIVGPSGCGKSVIARQLFGDDLVLGYEWDRHKSVVDGFPTKLGIKEITALLSSVGFSSPPSWLRPFGALSNGEQFRVTIARALAEHRPLIVVDEFTSVVDRTVAKIGSAAVAKTIRRRAKSTSTPERMIALSCHYDVIDWLQPDWVYHPGTAQFDWREVQPRPRIRVEVAECDKAAWGLFVRHHYLSSKLPHARCFVGFIEGRPAVFTAWRKYPTRRKTIMRATRTVVLPDFQGIGVGNAMVDHMAAKFKAEGWDVYSTTGSVALINHRLRSPLWRMFRGPGLTARAGKTSAMQSRAGRGRFTASFEFLGAAAESEGTRARPAGRRRKAAGPRQAGST